MVREDEFLSLKPAEIQPILIDVVDTLSRATATLVLTKKADEMHHKIIGTKSIMKIIETGKESMEQMILDIANEFGPQSAPVKDIAKIGHLMSEGIKCSEIMTLINSGYLSSLKKPELQTALVTMTSKKGHASTVCKVITEESLEQLDKFEPIIDTAKMSELKEKLDEAEIQTVTVKSKYF